MRIIQILIGIFVLITFSFCRGDFAVKPGFAQAAETSNKVSGSISASFSVSQGSPIYQMALMLPPGTRGIQPSLKLVYAAGYGNGIVGVGVRLQGVNAITRCGTQIVSDNIKGGVAYNDNDQFCLDDQRLIQVKDNTYRTQIESWQRITSIGTCGSGPCSFKLERKDGTYSTFGAANGSAILAKPSGGASIPTRSIRAWMQDTVTDPNGNTISFNYTQAPCIQQPCADSGNTSNQSGTGQSYLDTIQYSPNGGPADSRKVQFVYETRSDSTLQYLGGGLIKTELLLSQIETSILPASCPGGACSSQSVMSYTLAYDTNPTTGRSRLASVTQCAASGTCFNSTTFQWTSGADSLSFTTASTDIPDNQYGAVGDFNGDGRSDILEKEFPYYIYLTNSNGDGFETGQNPWPNGVDFSNFSDHVYGDFNGDGLTDVFMSSSYYEYQLCLGSGDVSFKFTCDTGQLHASWDYLLSGDFNGDGLTDLLTVLGSSGTIYLSQKTSFAKAGTPTGLMLSSDDGGNYVADFTGDGRADLLVFISGSGGTLYPSSETNNSDTTLGKGISLTNAYLSGDYHWVADFNNDGLTDLLVASNDGTGYINYGTGVELQKGQTQLTGLKLNSQSYVGDFNGDGFPDLYTANVYFSCNNQVPPAGTICNRNSPPSGATGLGLMYLGDGALFHVVESSGSQLAIYQAVSATGSYFGDFNGDGLTDIFTSEGSQSVFNYAGAYNGATVTTTVATSNQAADMLDTITDGYGGQIVLTSKPITDTSVYQRTSSFDLGSELRGIANLYNPTPLSPTLIQTYPVQSLRGARYVLASYTQSNDASLNNSGSFSYSYNYNYQNGALNLLGRGWLGFETVTVTDPQLKAQTTTTYNQDFPKNGRVSTRTTCDIQYPTPETCTDSSSVFRSNASVTWVCVDSQSGTEPLSSCVVDNSDYDKSATQVFYVTPQQSTTEDETLGNQVVTNFSFDNWGNLELISALGYQKDPNSVALYTCKSYFPADQDKWTFGFLQYRKQTIQENCTSNISSWQQGDLQLEQYGYDKSTGNRTTQLRWDDQNKIWLGALMTFTDQGLTKTVTELSGASPGVVNGTTYTIAHDQGFSTFVSSVTSPNPGNGKNPLTKNYAYDARFGVKVAESDANGNLINTCVDDFGRTATVQGPLQENAPASSNCIDKVLYPYLDAKFTGNTNMVTTDTYSYVTDPTQAVTSMVEQHLNTWTGDDWTPLTRVLDGLGRTVALNYQNDRNASMTVQAKYLDASHLSQHSLPAPASALPVWKTYAYDTLGRTQQVSQPIWGLDGTQTTTTSTWAYTRPNTVTVTEAVGTNDSVTQTRVLRYYGSQAQVHTAQIKNATTTIDHDGLARAIKVTNPTPKTGSAVVDTVSYDSLGRVLKRSDSGSGTMTYQYDVHGNLCGIGDSLGQTIQVSWDPLHRRTAQKLYEKNQGGTGDLCSSSQGSLQSTITLAYDVASGSNANNPLGHLTMASIAGPKGPTISYGYGYDSWSRPITQDLVLGTHNKQAFAVSYDPQGRVLTRTYPQVNGVRPKTKMSFWSGNGKLHNVSYAADGENFKSWLELSNYSPYNQPQNAGYGNGANEVWSYQPDDLLASHMVTDGSGIKLVNKAFGWNQLQSIETILDCNYGGNSSQQACNGHTGTAPSNGGLQYGYDPVQRLQTVSGSMEGSYSYDDAGNLTANNGVTFGYEGNQVQTGNTATAGQVFSAKYNVNGEMTSRSTGSNLETTLGTNYSVKGWLLETQLNQKVHERLAYDFRGRRVVKTVYKSDGTTVDRAVVSLAPDFEIALSNGGGAEYTVYLRDANGKFAALTEALSEQDVTALVEALGLKMTLNPKALAAKKQSLVFHRDQVGSTEAVTNDTGATYATVTYDPWGTPSITPADHNKFRPLFDGKEYSSVTGLYDFNARYYDTFTGRFVSADTQVAAGPLRPDGFNDYAYALNNPLVYADPSGNFPVKAALDVAKISIAAVSVLTDSEEFLPAEEELADAALQQVMAEAPEAIEGDAAGSSLSSSSSVEGDVSGSSLSSPSSVEGDVAGSSSSLSSSEAPVVRCDPNELTFRGDTREPDEIFATGFQPWGGDATLKDYVESSASSQYVGTTRNEQIAARKFGRYIYTVRPGYWGIDVDATLGADGSWEDEVAVPGGIPRERIRGIREVTGNINGIYTFGEEIRNPHFDNFDDLDGVANFFQTVEMEF